MIVLILILFNSIPRWFCVFPIQFHFVIINSFKFHRDSSLRFRLASRVHCVGVTVYRLMITFVGSSTPILVTFAECTCGLLIYILVNLTAVVIWHPTWTIRVLVSKLALAPWLHLHLHLRMRKLHHKEQLQYLYTAISTQNTFRNIGDITTAQILHRHHTVTTDSILIIIEFT